MRKSCDRELHREDTIEEKKQQALASKKASLQSKITNLRGKTEKNTQDLENAETELSTMT